MVGIAVAVGGGLVAGGLTSFGQTYLPPAINSFANSAGGWTMLAFLLVWVSRARPLLAAVLGVLAFEALVEGYRIVSGWRGFYYAEPFSGIFSLVGLLAGPVVGVAASLTRYGSPPWRVLGITPLAAVLAGEGVYGLRFVSDTTSSFYWTLEILLAVAFLIMAVVRYRPGVLWAVVATVITAAGAATFLVGYVRLGQ